MHLRHFICGILLFSAQTFADFSDVEKAEFEGTVNGGKAILAISEPNGAPLRIHFSAGYHTWKERDSHALMTAEGYDVKLNTARAQALSRFIKNERRKYTIHLPQVSNDLGNSKRNDKTHFIDAEKITAFFKGETYKLEKLADLYISYEKYKVKEGKHVDFSSFVSAKDEKFGLATGRIWKKADINGRACTDGVDCIERWVPCSVGIDCKASTGEFSQENKASVPKNTVKKINDASSSKSEKEQNSEARRAE